LTGPAPDGPAPDGQDDVDQVSALSDHDTVWPDDPFAPLDLPTQRRDARERAVTLLYEAEMKSVAGTEIVDELTLAPDPMASELVVGVTDKATLLDEHISASLDKSWSLHRLAVLDRIVLRIATYELMFRPKVPTGAAINEAVEMAKRFSGPEAGKFVNGVLSAIARSVR